jgi:hypothetical protein
MPHMPSLCATYYCQGQHTYIQSFCIFEKYSMFMKIRSLGAELFHADRRTDRHDEANSRFPRFFERA